MTPLERMNMQHFVVQREGATRVASDHDASGNPIPLTFHTFQDFRNWYLGETIEVEVEEKDETGQWKTKKKQIAKASWWLNHPGKRRYRTIDFCPKGCPPDVYNLWQGFGFEPEPGEWGRFRQHIHEVVCNGDDGLFDYVLKWMARAVQYPEKPGEVALVMRGAKGSGKGTFANNFMKLFGAHQMSISNRAHLTGRFNAHLRDKIVLFVDEGFWAGDHEGEGVLKQMITEPEFAVEQKHVDAATMVNRLHIIMASNEHWVVPARGLERRFCVMDINDKYAQDTDYFFAIHQELEQGGYAAMLHDLMHLDISNFNVRKAPKTEALMEQMLHSLKPFDAWWFNRLCVGSLSDHRQMWERAPVDEVYDTYCGENRGDKHKMSKQQFGALLRKYLPEPGLHISRPKDKYGKRTRLYELPPLDDCRAMWDKLHGVSVDWKQAEGDE